MVLFDRDMQVSVSYGDSSAICVVTGLYAATRQLKEAAKA